MRALRGLVAEDATLAAVCARKSAPLLIARAMQAHLLHTGIQLTALRTLLALSSADRAFVDAMKAAELVAQMVSRAAEAHSHNARLTGYAEELLALMPNFEALAAQQESTARRASLGLGLSG